MPDTHAAAAATASCSAAWSSATAAMCCCCIHARPCPTRRAAHAAGATAKGLGSSAWCNSPRKLRAGMLNCWWPRRKRPASDTGPLDAQA
jgi:hypothetical protein